MKPLKNIILLLLAVTILISCESDNQTLPTNEVNKNLSEKLTFEFDENFANFSNQSQIVHNYDTFDSRENNFFNQYSTIFVNSKFFFKFLHNLKITNEKNILGAVYFSTTKENLNERVGIKNFNSLLIYSVIENQIYLDFLSRD